MNPQTPPPELPLLYSKLLTLSADEHAGHGLLPAETFGFARRANALPLGVGEFAVAARHYPIVFAEGPLPVPAAITGIVEGRNLFLDRQGHWLADSYVPGYVRRHPFFLQVADDGRSALLCVDAASERFVPLAQDARAQPLFEADGSPAAPAREAMAFCRLVHDEQMRTTAFARALLEHQLLRPREANFTLPDGSRYTLRGFRVIDDEAFRALPGEVLSAWAQRGWIDAVVLHMVAMQNWAALLQLHGRRIEEELAALRQNVRPVPAPLPERAHA